MRETDRFELELKRSQMNELDGQLSRLLERRFALSGEIIALKRLIDEDAPILDVERERYIIAVVGPDERVRDVYRLILKLTKEGRDG